LLPNGSLQHDAVLTSFFDLVLDVGARACLSRVEDPVGGDIGLEVGMDVRPPGGRLDIEDDRQIFVLDIDQLDRVSGGCGISGHHDCHDLAGKVDLVDRDRVVVRDLVVGRERPGSGHRAHVIGKISSSEDRDHAGGTLGLVHIDRGDLGVRDRAAHHAKVEHAGDGDVVGVASPAGDQPLIFLAEPRSANLDCALRRLFGDRHRTLPAA
jgi:hypothetical protein